MLEDRYRFETISTLALCWTNIRQTVSQNDLPLEKLKGELSVAGRMLVRATKVDEDVGVKVSDDLKKLFELDEGLRDVFG